MIAGVAMYAFLRALGVGWELAQGMGVLSGTYDPLDLAAYLGGWAVASVLPLQPEMPR